MDPITKLAQADGEGKMGKTITNYTVTPPAYAQPQVPNKTPLHSRTQPEYTSLKK